MKPMSDNLQTVIKSGKQLREWRLASGLSQDTLAQAFECTRQTIARLEASGDTYIPREWMYALTFLKRFPQEFGLGDEQRMRSPKPRKR
jgi:transcriptional regulator with XRE-family HTH domain